jgi:hypothetical protein
MTFKYLCCLSLLCIELNGGGVVRPQGNEQQQVGHIEQVNLCLMAWHYILFQPREFVLIHKFRIMLKHAFLNFARTCSCYSDLVLNVIVW